MRLAFFAICLFTQTLSAAPGTSVGRSADGLTAYCKVNSDVGIWAYTMTGSSIDEAGGTLNVAIDMSFLKCGNTSAGFEWIARMPFEPISRIKGGKVEITLVDQVSGVLLDGDTYSRIYAPASNDAKQTFRFAIDESQILAELGRMKSGESYTKKFYFVVEHHERLSNGSSRYVAGGSYDLSLAWTKAANTLSVSVSQIEAR